ncbi:nitrous oxidase accessory protein [Salegentibacter mishustinae]|uniref:Nitrous oxide reductase n=1 Tax=Salegentibacter mishustinae TaxID=270918 RepID=A0A0Q9ZBX6_9FLAO|nr:nitrous oxide reductase family maturation protein NosD [Salegentibacter mishustinae]KRG30560.1 nitrous oxide reductase [Salegentibacter mishustinae]PNW23451.1 nitrous oxide reductase [Salegentibacter mishustinae]PZX66518.1 nitrous oxidase accessory protein [Salegentibacter mishustinae]
MLRSFFLFLFLVLASVVSQAQEIEVCKSCEVKTIQAAVDMAEDGDILRIKSGTYKEHDISIIDKSLTIIGEGFPVIDAEMEGTAVSVRAENFSIEGLKIINVGRSHTNDFAGILVSNAKNFEIKNNRLDQVFFGILLERSSEGTVSGNIITSNAESQSTSGNGVHIWKSEEITVKNNEVIGLRDGIYLEFVNNSEIINNLCKDNLRYGLHFMFSDHDLYKGNIFENNGAGVAVMYSKFIDMQDNQFRKNWGSASYGLLLKEINDSELKNNIFEDNTIAISADNTNRIDYIENDFRNNGYAIRIRGAVYDNNFKRNNFLYNSFDVAYTGRLNNNKFTNNYWSGYSGYDLNRDGIGDVPFRPVTLFSYLVNKTPEAIVLLRSTFIDLLDFSEKVSPIFTPADLIDAQPQMKRIQW